VLAVSQRSLEAGQRDASITLGYVAMAEPTGGWTRARTCGCLSRRQAVVMLVVGVVYAALGVLLFLLRVGPLPELALLLLWPALAHWHMALYYIFDVDSGVWALGKAPGSWTAVLGEAAGPLREGGGLYDPPGAERGPSFPMASSASSRNLAIRTSASNRGGLPADPAPSLQPSSRPPVILCFGGGCGCCSCCCVRGCRLVSAGVKPQELRPQAAGSALVGPSDAAAWTPDAGTVWLPSVAWLFPALLSQWATWFVRHTVSIPVGGERPYDLVAPGIYVGRWPLRFPSEFPRRCPNVVDLTSEFPARADVLAGRRYACVPSLDCTMPEPGPLIAVAAEVATWRGDVYVHCANGHGRSACFAALLMLQRGDSASWREALAAMKQVRPYVGVHGPQAALMDVVEASMRGCGMLPPPSEPGARPGVELPDATAPTPGGADGTDGTARRA